MFHNSVVFYAVCKTRLKNVRDEKYYTYLDFINLCKTPSSFFDLVDGLVTTMWFFKTRFNRRYTI